MVERVDGEAERWLEVSCAHSASAVTVAKVWKEEKSPDSELVAFSCLGFSLDLISSHGNKTLCRKSRYSIYIFTTSIHSHLQTH